MSANITDIQPAETIATANEPDRNEPGWPGDTSTPATPTEPDRNAQPAPSASDQPMPDNEPMSDETPPASNSAEPDSHTTPPATPRDSATTTDIDGIPAGTGQCICHRSLVDDGHDHRPVRERLADAGVLHRILVIGAAVILVVALAGRRLRTGVST